MHKLFMHTTKLTYFFHKFFRREYRFTIYISFI
nr:MAG TPA: hypothetical protein [Bacteriophage sp.]